MSDMSLPESVCFADFLKLELSAHFTSLSYWNLTFVSASLPMALLSRDT